MQLCLLRKGQKQGRMEAGSIRSQKMSAIPQLQRLYEKGSFSSWKYLHKPSSFQDMIWENGGLERGPGNATALLAILQLAGLVRVAGPSSEGWSGPQSCLLLERWRVVAGHVIWKRFLTHAPGSFSEGKPSTEHALHPVACKWPMFCMPLPSLNWEVIRLDAQWCKVP